MASVSPLDRLLNQKNRPDNIHVQISCRTDGTDRAAISKGYDLIVEADSINNHVCMDGSIPEEGKICVNDPNEAILCS